MSALCEWTHLLHSIWRTFGQPYGRTRKFTEPTPAISDEILRVDIRHFKTATEDIRSDTDSDTADCLSRAPKRITRLVIKVEGGCQETCIAEFDGDIVAERIPAELQEKLIKIADQFIYPD